MAIAIVFILSVLGGGVLPAVAGADDLPPAACGAAQLPCEPSNENDLLLQITSSLQSESSGGLEGNLGSAPAAHDDDAAVEDELTHEEKEEIDVDGSGFQEGAIEGDHDASLLEAAENQDPQWARTIRWGDQVALSTTVFSYKTSNCGWYGCEVAFMNNDNPKDKFIQFSHGSILDRHDPSWRFGWRSGGFYIRPMPPATGTVSNLVGCVKWGDQVALSTTFFRHKTSNCGWYGCEVAFRDKRPSGKGGGRARFAHGSQLDGFYVQPMPPATGTVATREGCVKWGDQFALSSESRNSKTPNCGWYGCRVAFMDHENLKKKMYTKIMKFGHGSILDRDGLRFGWKRGSFYMRPHPLQKYCEKVKKCAKVGEIRSCAEGTACSKGAEDALARVKAEAKATLIASKKAKVMVRAEAIKWASSAPIEEIA